MKDNVYPYNNYNIYSKICNKVKNQVARQKGRRADALALRADERRDKLR